MVRMIKQAISRDGFLGSLHTLLLMDDAVLLATNREMCLKKLAIVRQFCRESGMVLNEKKTKFFVVNGEEGDKQCLETNEVKASYSHRYLYLGAWFTDTAKMDHIMALHEISGEAVVNKFSIFCAGNTQMPFIYKKKVFDAAVMTSLMYSS